MSTMNQLPATGPAGVTALLESLLAAQPARQDRPPLRYLRRKAGRGLVAVYGSARDPGQLYTVTVDQAALDATAAEPGPDPATADPAWQGEWPGIVEEPSLGITVQAFPADRQLPGLAAAMAPQADSALWAALESAGNRQLADGGSWNLASVTAEPLRYKPGDRCVLRYRLRVRRSRPDGDGQTATVGVVGKLYRQRSQATAAAALLGRLADETGGAWSPAPYTTVPDLPLLLSEDLGCAADQPPTLIGSEVITGADERAWDALVQAATALADLHTSSVATADTAPRTGPDEAAKAAKRAGLLADYLPGLADRIELVSAELAARLRALEPDVCWPAHGSFKPSQLLLRGRSVFVIDLDQFCRADPALDVGYFLAYLRPAGLWYGKAGAGEWFDRAAQVFTSAYTAQLRSHDVPDSTSSRIIERARLYQAALLLKIATRRRNRLHSPRPAEVEAILNDIQALLGSAPEPGTQR